MNLDEYISRVGDHETAELFGVKVRTIESWRRRERFPMPPKAKEIEKATRGAVSFAECYEHTL